MITVSHTLRCSHYLACQFQPVVVYINKALLEQIAPSQQSAVIATETEWPAEPKIFTTWPFAGKLGRFLDLREHVGKHRILEFDARFGAGPWPLTFFLLCSAKQYIAKGLTFSAFEASGSTGFCLGPATAGTDGRLERGKQGYLHTQAGQQLQWPLWPLLWPQILLN